MSTVEETKKAPGAVPREGHHLLNRERVKLVDLSRELYQGMPLWPGHQLPFVMTNQTHEGFKEKWGTKVGFEAHNWLMSEHTGTHIDAIFEYDPNGPTLDRTPLEWWYAITCLATPRRLLVSETRRMSPVLYAPKKNLPLLVAPRPQA